MKKLIFILAFFFQITFLFSAAGEVLGKTRPNGLNEANTFNELGRLVSIADTLNTRNLLTLNYQYDNEGNKLSEIKSFPGLTGESIFLYSGNQLVEEHSSAGSTWTIHGLGIDDVNRITKNGVNFYPLTNDQGSVYAVTDASGNVLQRYDYSTFGKLTVQNADGKTVTDAPLK